EPLGGFIGDSIALPAFQGGLLVTYVGFIFVQDVWLGLAAIALYPPQAYLIPKLQRKINQLSRQRVKTVRKLAFRVGETVNSATDIKANDTGTLERADISHRLGKIFRIRNEIFRRKFFIKFLNNFLAQLTPFFFFSIGGYLVLEGRLSLGALVAVLAAYKDIGPPWKELLKFYQITEDTRVKYAQIIKQFEPSNIRSEALHLDSTVELPKFSDSISTANVALTEEHHHSKLEGINLILQIPEHSGILCTDRESGKELGLLIAGLDPPTVGDLRFDDTDVKQLSDAVLGMNVGYCSPGSQLLNVSVEDNLLYGLKHRPIDDQTATALSDTELREAIKSGNSLHNIKGSWVNLHSVGVETEEQFDQHISQVIAAVELDQDIMGLALGSHLSEGISRNLMNKIVEARKEVRDTIRDMDDGRLIETFERTVYSQNLTVGENLMFGTPYNSEVSLESLTQQQQVKQILSSLKLDEDLIGVGLEAARLMIDLFKDVDATSDLYARYSFIEASRMEQYRELVEKIDSIGVQSCSESERRMLISIALQISPAQHRLALITPEIQDRIVNARGQIMRSLGQDNDIIQFIDQDTYQLGMNVRENLLFGRISFDRRHLIDRIHERLNQVLRTLGLEKDFLERGLLFRCGEAGSLLSQTFRQKLLLARALAKNPPVLIIEEPLAALNFDTQQRIFDNVKKLRSGKNLIWIFSDERLSDQFDRVFNYGNNST
ncbi:MAG: ATP-binding cassette domain-containing protein, partial [bacterium]